MDQKKLIERFNGDVDALLMQRNSSHPVVPTSTDYDKMLSTARMLSSMDFSQQSQIRQSLRRRLLTEASPWEGWSQTERISMVTLFHRRSISVPVAFLAALLIITLIWPSVVAAAVRSAVAFAQQLWVGEYTSVAPLDPEEITITEDGRLTMPGRMVEDPGEPAGQKSFDEAGSFELEVRSFDSMAGAQAAAPFALRQPSYLPEGYAFSKASVWGDVHVNITYTGPDGDLLFIQRPVGEQPGQTVSIGLPDDYLIEPIQVNGQDAVWAEHVLLWEADGYSYLLSSPGLSQLDAVRFAESLE